MCSKSFQNLLEQHVNIVSTIDILKIDYDFDLLKKQLIATKKSQYDIKDFYLVSHFDLEYFMPGSNYSLTAFNLIRTFQEVDISTGRILLVTNCFGYLESFKSLIPNELHEFELPLVIDDCISASPANYATFEQCSSLVDLPLDQQTVEYPALCLMGRSRVHRNAIFNCLNDDNLLSKVVTSYRNYSHES